MFYVKYTVLLNVDFSKLVPQNNPAKMMIDNANLDSYSRWEECTEAYQTEISDLRLLTCI